MQKLTTVSILLLVVMGGAAMAYVAAQPFVHAMASVQVPHASQTTQTTQTQSQLPVQQHQNSNSSSLLTNGPPAGSASGHPDGDDGSGGLDD